MLVSEGNISENQVARSQRELMNENDMLSVVRFGERGEELRTADEMPWRKWRDHNTN